MADIASPRNLNPPRRHRTYPRVVKRARHNSYRVKKPADKGTDTTSRRPSHWSTCTNPARQPDQNRLSGIAPRDHPTVMEVLTAFIREHSHKQWTPLDPRASRGQERSTRPDVQAAFTVVGGGITAATFSGLTSPVRSSTARPSPTRPPQTRTSPTRNSPARPSSTRPSSSNEQPHPRQAPGRHRLGEQRQPRPVRPRQPGARPRPLTLGDSELVAQHQDLGVLLPRLPARQPEQRHDTGYDQEDQLQAHKPKIIPPPA